ncbi:hypothetical protein A6U86_29400 [Rhizobium sp. AC27/96]|uniref:hypothetical protein n=1 Tax=Rhizobium sp. AC27/96 TaxID=1841653 RepID=UPI000829351A|nr:hypothetical protein [Rhizobium sp. AC27/96]OCJ05379.1 hypothetical protein A6U86_29400 [Rhizobium sp. AC27/96]
MKRDLPTPEQILEELAGKVAVHIEHSAPVAFDNALDELLRYHEFLLSLNATPHIVGESFNFAQVRGQEFLPPHVRWIRTYRRLFERAAERIPTESHFLRVLSRVPLRLLESPATAELPQDVVEWIIRSGPVMMHQIEAWVTRRTTVEVPKGGSAVPRLTLAGADEKSYANVLPEIIGSWERLLQLAPYAYHWRDSLVHGQDKGWAAFAASWPFLWQHLSSTAYCLAVAVWNEDEAGAKYFREALVRWPDTLGHRQQDHLLRWDNLVFPHIVTLDFPGAVNAVANLRFENAPPPTAEALFDALIRAAHQDVVLLTSALLLFWTMEGKQASDIGGKTARALLLREGHDQLGPAENQLNFRNVLLELFRLWMPGQDQSDRSYDSALDRLVESLDDMTERRVVPGRVYTPSTLNGCDDLMLAFAALLTAALPDADENVEAAVRELAARDERLPGGDASLRGILQTLDLLDNALEQSADEIIRVQTTLTGGAGLADSKDRLASVIELTRQVIGEERQKHLHERPADPQRIERIRASIETALLAKSAQLWFFRNVDIRDTRNERGELIEVRLAVSKKQIVAPPMETPWLGLEGWAASECKGRVAYHAWRSFLRRPRKGVDVSGSVADEAFWRAISPLVEQLQSSPALVVAEADADLLLRLVHRNSSNLRIEQMQGFELPGSYIAHVERIAVYSGGPKDLGPLLFSSSALRQIDHGRIGELHATVDFDTVEGSEGRLRVRFRQMEHWSAAPIFELHATGHRKVSDEAL